MDMKIFNNMDTYFDVYACLAQKPRAKNELQDLLINKGKPKSTAKTHVAKAEKGELGFVTGSNGQLRFETEQFKETITQLCKEMGLTVSFDDKPKKKPTPEDAIAAVTVSHSPEYIKAKQMADQAAGVIKDLKNELSQKDKQIATLSAELEKRAIADTVSQMNQKKLVIGTAQFKPDGALEADFFTDAKKKLLDVSGLVSRNGNKDTDVSEGATELNEENYLKRIARTLFNGNLLRLIADGNNVMGEKSKPDSEKERLESINEILRMENVPNQVKLSLYALWFKGDSEMENLLNYAGEHCINADYVIRLLKEANICDIIREYTPYECMWPVRDENLVPDTKDIFYSQRTEDDQVHVIRREFLKDEHGQIYSKYFMKAPGAKTETSVSDYGFSKEKWKEKLPEILKEGGFINEQPTAVVHGKNRFVKYQEFIEENFKKPQTADEKKETEYSSKEAEGFVIEHNRDEKQRRSYEESLYSVVTVPVTKIMTDDEQVMCLELSEGLLKGIMIDSMDSKEAHVFIRGDMQYSVKAPDAGYRGIDGRT